MYTGQSNRGILIDKVLIKEILIYGIIGVIAAGGDSILFGVLSNMGINLYIANFISVNVGIGTSFVLNTYINFKTTNSIRKRLLRFFSVGYIGMIISTLMLYVGEDLLDFNILLVKLASVVIVAVIQFILNKLITYKKGLD